jgi:hypothetical protein
VAQVAASALMGSLSLRDAWDARGDRLADCPGIVPGLGTGAFRAEISQAQREKKECP